MTGIERYTQGIAEHLPSALPEYRSAIAISHAATVAAGAGVDVVYIPRGPRVLQDQVRLAWALNRAAPDIAYFPGFCPPALLPRHTRVVAHIHDAAIWNYRDTLSRGTRFYYRPLLQFNLTRGRIDAITTNSKSAEADITPHIPAHIPIRGVPLGVAAPDAASDPLGVHPSERSQPFALAVGTVEPRKNYEVLLSAWEILAIRGAQIPLKIVGRPGWGDPLSRLSVARHLVEILPGLSDEEVSALYRTCSLFVMPSRYEGFGMPVVEAMLRGSRCIVSDIPVFHEIGGEALTYVDPDSPRAWADTVSDVWYTEVREFDPEPALARARRFTWERCAAAVAAVIRPAA